MITHARRWLPLAAAFATAMFAVGTGRGSFGAPPPAQPPDVLRGPEIPDRVARTLVHFDARGRLVRVEGRPEVAALALLELEPDVRARADGAVIDRSTAISVLLIENLDLVTETADAVAGGDRDRAAAVARALYERFEPGFPRAPLLKPLQTVLPPDAYADLVRLSDEYWQAWLERELRNVKPKDRSDELLRQTERRLTESLFNEEVRAAYERTLLPYRDRLEAIDRAVEPTVEQREAIRAIFIDFIKRTRLQPSPQQRREVTMRIYLLLDDDRRTKLFELILQQL